MLENLPGGIVGGTVVGSGVVDSVKRQKKSLRSNDKTHVLVQKGIYNNITRKKGRS